MHLLSQMLMLMLSIPFKNPGVFVEDYLDSCTNQVPSSIGLKSHLQR